jgi:hypothetical protein
VWTRTAKGFIKMANLGGLYYPGESWDLSSEDSMLKKCLLFFDKIYAIVPEVFSVDWQDVQPDEELIPFYRDLRQQKLEMEQKILKSIEAKDIQFAPEQEEASLHEIKRHSRIIKFLEKIELLRKEGILELVNPRENLIEPPYWPPSSEPYPWMHIADDYKSILKKGIFVDKLEDYKPPILYGSILRDLRDDQFRAIAAKSGKDRIIVYKGQAEQNWLSQLGKASGSPEDEWQYSPSLVHYFGFPGTVSTVMWAALVINHTLMTAHRYNLIPITPNTVFSELLQLKLRYLKTIQVNKRYEEKYIDHPEFKAAFSALSLSICSLPNLDLVSFDDVLELRYRLREELVAFRDEMFRLSDLIKASPWEPKFQSQVAYIIEHRINPAVRDLQHKLKTNQQEAVLQALRIGSAPTIFSIVASIWAGMPLILAMAVAAGLISIETALTYYFNQKKIYQSNGLSFILHLQ